MKLYGWFIRQLKIFAHKYDWHHMEKAGPFSDGSSQRWCHWCGLRVNIPAPDPMAVYKAMFESQ